jgi:alpha-glucosidase
VTLDLATADGSRTATMTVGPRAADRSDLRWTELGAFTPYMRTHQGGKKLTNWSSKSDAETSAHFARILRALAPEFQALAAAAATTSAPIVRHLMLAYPDDPGSRAVSDEYLIGDTMLVAPVVVEGATTKDVYLPPGTWYHVWTGTAYAGPGTITVPAPIGSPPVFSRDVDRPDLRAIM